MGSGAASLRLTNLCGRIHTGPSVFLLSVTTNANTKADTNENASKYKSKYKLTILSVNTHANTKTNTNEKANTNASANTNMNTNWKTPQQISNILANPLANLFANPLANPVSNPVKLQQEDWTRIHQKAMKRLNKAAKSIEKPCRTSQLVPTDRFWRDSLAMCERMSSRWFSLLRTNEPILCKKQAGGQSFRGRTTTT